MVSRDDLEILAEFTKRFGGKIATDATLEDYFTSKDYFGLETASPLQRAICRVADGRDLGDLYDHPDVVQYLGNRESIQSLRGRPSELGIIAGIRSAKSLFAACVAVYATQSCDVSHLGPGEIPRVSVVSLQKDLANVIYNHVIGNVQCSPILSRLLIGDPTSDTVVLRHPTGRPIEIKVTAGSRAGGSLVARWSAGCIFDEFPRMTGGGEGVVNYNDLHDAVKGRLLPGAQIVSIGSPWGPSGPAFKMVQDHWRRPTDEIVVVKAPARAMNPVWWTEARCERLRETDPDVYRTDIEAEFLEPAEAMFSSHDLDASIRKQLELPPDKDMEYVAAIDPATRGNDWALVVAGKKHDGKKSIVLHRRWQGSRAEPLSPEAVLKEIYDTISPYTTLVYTDQYAGDALRDIGKHCGLYLIVQDWTAKKKVDMFTRFRTEMSAGMIELPPDPMIRSDLMSVKKVITQNGISIRLPTSGDGRHCDYAPAIVMAVSRFLAEPREKIPTAGTAERAQWIADKMEEEDEAMWEESKGAKWWVP